MLSDSQIRVSIGGDTCFITQSGLDKGNADKKNVKRRSRIPKKPRNPQPKEWLSSELSQNYIADYKPFNFVDGEGVRCSLYVSGCLFEIGQENQKRVRRYQGYLVLERLYVE